MEQINNELQVLREELFVKMNKINKLKNLNISEIRRLRILAKILIAFGIITIFIISIPILFYPQPSWEIIALRVFVLPFLLIFNLGIFLYLGVRQYYKRNDMDIRRYLDDSEEFTNDIILMEMKIAEIWEKIRELLVKRDQLKNEGENEIN
jgi:hypothetical protein